MLFLQSAGTDRASAHELVAAVTEAGPTVDPKQLTIRLRAAGFEQYESELVALAVLMTHASSTSELDVEWIGSVANGIGDPNLLLETAGVAFAFNTINRIADARRVPLEYRFLRELKSGAEEVTAPVYSHVVYDIVEGHEVEGTAATRASRGPASGAGAGLGSPALGARAFDLPSPPSRGGRKES